MESGSEVAGAERPTVRETERAQGFAPRRLHRALDTYYARVGELSSGVPLTGGRPCDVRQAWPDPAPQAWAEIGWQPEEPGYDACGIVEGEAPHGRVLVARGDLDCDGVQWNIELGVWPDPAGGVARQDRFWVENELE